MESIAIDMQSDNTCVDTNSLEYYVLTKAIDIRFET